MRWYSRWYASTVSSITRLYAAGAAALRAPLPRLGISMGRVAALPMAEADLSAMATSPTVYSALTRSALETIIHPIRVYRGYSVSGGDLEPIDPRERGALWVGALLRVLQTPDPASADELAPEPGEALIAQILADLKMAGAFVVAPVLSERGWVVGLTRLHPKCCSIERTAAGEEVVYRSGSDHRRYPRRSVFIGHLLSWAADGRAEFGVGAGTPLRPLLRAEAAALAQTANMIEQGGADLRIRGKGATGKSFMALKENREKAIATVTESIVSPNGRRVIAFSDDLELDDGGLKPTDLRAPELMAAARGHELAATGTVPAWVGHDAGTYATAVVQLRVQACMDEGYAAVIEAYFLRPLARHFAKTRGAGTMDARRADEITARIDLSAHPGYAQLRTESYARMKVLVHDLGFTVEQAAAAEHLDLPAPRGEILSKGASTDPGTPGPELGSHNQGPRDPVGDNGDEKVSNPERFNVEQLFPAR